MNAPLTFAVFALCLALGAAPAVAQTSNVTSADVLRLQDSVYLAERDLSELERRNPSLAAQLRRQLDDLRDETIYLKVKLRKEGSLARPEFADVQTRLDRLRARARTGDSTSAPAGAPVTRAPANEPAAAPSPPAAAGSGRDRSPATTPGATATSGSNETAGASRGSAGVRSGREIPAGTELDVRLQNTLNSGTAQVEDRFEGTTVVDLSMDGRTLIPAGSVLRGVVSGVEPATRTNRTARMTLSFDQLEAEGVTYEIRGTVTEAIEGEGIKGEAGRIGAGAGVGAIIGGILGGFKGALAGILIGGGGVIAATEGKDVELPQGTVLRVRLDSPVALGR
jgi:hypothetical protein